MSYFYLQLLRQLSSRAYELKAIYSRNRGQKETKNFLVPLLKRKKNLLDLINSLNNLGKNLHQMYATFAPERLYGLFTMAYDQLNQFLTGIDSSKVERPSIWGFEALRV